MGVAINYTSKRKDHAYWSRPGLSNSAATQRVVPCSILPSVQATVTALLPDRFAQRYAIILAGCARQNTTLRDGSKCRSVEVDNTSA